MLEAIPGSLSQLARLGVQTALNSLWQGALMVLVIWLVMRCLPRVNAATRHAVWYATLLGLAVMPLFSGRFVSGPPAPATTGKSADSPALVRYAQPMPPADYDKPKMEGAPDLRSRVTGMTSPVEPRAAGSSEHFALSRSPGDPAEATIYSPILFKSGPWIWALAGGFGLILSFKWTKLAASLIHIRRIKSQAEPMAPELGPLWSSWCRDARRGGRIWLGWSDSIDVPAVFGFSRPAILFPRRLRGTLNDTETQQVALHELAHVARYDDWWQVLQRVIEAALFFHPVVRFVSRQIALEREIACDDWVMHRLHRPKEYAHCLARLAEHRSAHPLPVPGAVRSKKHIVRRIEMILNRNRNTAPVASRALSAIAAACLALMVIQAGFTTPVVAVTPPSPPKAATSPEPLGPPEMTPHPESLPETPTPPRPAHVAVAPKAEDSPAPPAVPSARTWAQAEPPDPPAPPAETPPPTPRSSSRISSHQELHSGKGSTLTLNQDGDEITWIWSDGGHKVRAEIDGHVTFSGAGEAVETISPDGYFLIEERSGGKSRELEIVPGRGNTLEYYYSENGDTRPYDESAKQWFAELLPAMMRETGLAAAERVTALRAEGGATAVLQEVSLISSDYVKRMYLEELMKSGPLSADEVRALFRQVGREMDSDYEKAELLIKYADYTDGDAETRDAYVEAVGGMDSDYEVRRVLSAMGTQEELSDSYAEAVLELAMGMDSDYEKAELLLELADYSRDHVAARDLYLEAVAGISSDYEKRRVLEGLLMPRTADSAFVDKVLVIARTIDSDFERVELLIRMADHAVAHDKSLSAYLAAVETVGSDFEARRALSALPWHDGISDEVCIDLLRVVSRLDSDFEKAEFLLEYGEHFTTSDAVRDAFDRAVDSIDSGYERQRVEASFYRHSRKSGSGRETY